MPTSSRIRGADAEPPALQGVEYHRPVDTALILIVLLIIALVIRGPKTLPQIGAMFGRGVREARRQLDKRQSKEGDDSRS